MHIAYTMTESRGDVDLLLRRVALRLISRGLTVRGTVQINSERCEGPCDMDVRVLPDGPVLRISQSLGAGSRGCRLDPAALERAVGLVEAGLRAGADVLVVNKFGKHEAEGRGFRPVIAEAIERGVPVIAGLNALNASAFEGFAGGLAVRLPAKVDAIADWLTERRAAVSGAA